MEQVTKSGFSIVGISVRTTNENGKAAKDIGALWGRFATENIANKIPNIIDETVYGVYTDYEGDHTKPYTTIVGFKVANLDSIPEGMVGKCIEEATYNKFIAKGDLTGPAIIEQWEKIWEMNLNRKFTSDFETYGEKAVDPTNGEAEIYIAVN